MRKCLVIPLVVICALLPAAAWSQLPPAYCTQWGSNGSGQGTGAVLQPLRCRG
jgi:hypothetical protein